ncbi:rho guanine nucleotide exchange factor 16 isoform X9 [Delphinus delphis]|uniref:rho guanine nucleotide exchange factor 16 isoform X9 n=1 Tax=Delphinus delphis TaxID=9728 RepID=UPI0028C3A2F7|nr:rho guanine nucleotide exchange factor 16 isoform X9 [Delphinus delphis]XP_059869202.1 rho guanine nucleotide exchange factor 16 isoform X9 [Delphinus delphis]XP_059869206.1 rho guanine nucleotide exchange factor 16 isoform X9 [Delphinus delphis]
MWRVWSLGPGAGTAARCPSSLLTARVSGSLCTEDAGAETRTQGLLQGRWAQGQAEGPGPGVQRHRPQGPSVKGSGAVGDIWAVPSACRGVDASRTPWELADPRFYQEIRERGLNTIHESDDDLLDEFSSPEETQKADACIVVKSYRPPQVTWSQLPEVVESGILDKLPAEEHERQEAIFEILISEFSYQHSLGILVAEFLQSRELRATMTQTEHHHLFSNITDVLSASQRFFEDLEKRHRAQVCVEDVSDILEEHAERHFHPYVSYCSNEVYQQRALQQLTSSSAAFREALREIEQRPACGGLPMISFLILPMQRVTRLPLLTDTLCLKTQGHPERYKAASRALKAISKLVKQCNEGAHRMERMEQMYTLHTQLDFSKVKRRPAGRSRWEPVPWAGPEAEQGGHRGSDKGRRLLGSLPLISASRWLLKRGELFVVEETGLFRKLSSRPTCYLFLFNDVLVVTKKKRPLQHLADRLSPCSEDSFVVQDYAQLDHIQVQKMEPSEASLPGGGNRSSFVPHTFQLTLLHNSEGRQEKILLSSDSASDRARWITALTHWERRQPDPTNKGDLLQVEITKAYLAKQADEITLQQADVVLVLEQEDGPEVGSWSLCILSGRVAPASTCTGRSELAGVSSAPEPSVGAEHLMEDQVPT